MDSTKSLVSSSNSAIESNSVNALKNQITREEKAYAKIPEENILDNIQNEQIEADEDDDDGEESSVETKKNKKPYNTFFCTTPLNYVPPLSTKTNRIGRYILIQNIGHGAFGEVFLAKHTLCRCKVAIKVLDKRKIDKKSYPKLIREIKILKLIDHPNIVKLYQVMETDTHVYLVMENCSGGELFNYLVDGRISEDNARKLIRPIISALQYCHYNNITHRDLKAENILLDQHMNIKIVDFGFSNEFHRGFKLNTFCGSPPYAAPELFNGKKYEGPEVDIWALGVLLYCLATGAFPFDSNQISELKEKVCQGRFRIPYYMSHELELLIRRLLCVNMIKRYTINDVVKNKWVNTKFELQPLVYDKNKHPSILNDGKITTTKRDTYQDPDIIKMIYLFGYEPEYVNKALSEDNFDEVMGCYLLLKDIKEGKVSIDKPSKSSKNPLKFWVNDKHDYKTSKRIKLNNEREKNLKFAKSLDKNQTSEDTVSNDESDDNSIYIMSSDATLNIHKVIEDKNINSRSRSRLRNILSYNPQINSPRYEHQHHRNSPIVGKSDRFSNSPQISGTSGVSSCVENIKSPDFNDNFIYQNILQMTENLNISNNNQTRTNRANTTLESNDYNKSIAQSPYASPGQESRTRSRTIISKYHSNEPNINLESRQKNSRLFNFFNRISGKQRSSSRSDINMDDSSFNRTEPSSSFREYNSLNDSSIQPRKIIFTWGVRTTTHKSIDLIHNEISRVLDKFNCYYLVRKQFVYGCVKRMKTNSGFKDVIIEFDLEICRIPKNMFGIHFKRVSGPSIHYKNFMNQIIETLRL